MAAIILASESPRRQELLSIICPEFRVIPANVDETMKPGTPPEEYVTALARRKAGAVADHADPGTIVIGADTIVVLDGEILGKPADEEDAFTMLSCLSGRKHSVFTGVAVVETGGRTETTAVETFVRFKMLSGEDIRRYIKTGEPMDKAGAYGIQRKGSLFIEGIIGDYFNVVGLPLCKLGGMLSGFGIDILAFL